MGGAAPIWMLQVVAAREPDGVVQGPPERDRKHGRLIVKPGRLVEKRVRRKLGR